MTTKKKPDLSKKENPSTPRKGPPPMAARGMAISFLLMAIFLTAMYLFSDSSKNLFLNPIENVLIFFLELLAKQ